MFVSYDKGYRGYTGHLIFGNDIIPEQCKNCGVYVDRRNKKNK